VPAFRRTLGDLERAAQVLRGETDDDFGGLRFKANKMG
jgi:hypothetical protein